MIKSASACITQVIQREMDFLLQAALSTVQKYGNFTNDFHDGAYKSIFFDTVRL